MSEFFDPNEKYDSQSAIAQDSMGLVETGLHGSVAVVTDAATTIWNSLTPQKMNASTYDVLSDIDQNAANIYAQNPDTIRTLSFIGGMVAPVGLAMKGIQMARAGAKGVSWFSQAGQVERLANVEKAYAQGLAGTQQLAILKRGYYAAVAANTVTDMVAAEVAINVAMSAHPFMEDYRKDWASNFLFSVGLGTAIGGTIGTVIAKREIAAALASEDAKVNKAILSSVTAPDKAEMNGSIFLKRHQNVENMKAYIADAKTGKTEAYLSPRTEETLNLLVEKEEARLVTEFNLAAPSLAMDTVPAEVNKFYRDKVADPRFAGAEKLGFYQVADSLADKPKTGLLQDWKFWGKETNKAGKEVTIKNDAVYSPKFDRFMSEEDAVNHSTLADLTNDFESLAKKATDSHAALGYKMRTDALVEASILPSARVQEDFARTYLNIVGRRYEDLAGKEFAVASDDLATLLALKHKQTIVQSEGLDISSFKYKLETRTISPNELDAVISGAALKHIKTMQETGYGIESIALRTGMKEDRVREILLTKPASVEVSGLSQFDSPQAIQEALAMTNRALSIQTNLNKVPAAEVYSQLNKKTMETLSQHMLEFHMLKSESALVQDVASKLTSEESKAQLHFLQEYLQDVSLSAIKSPFWTSANATLDRLGPIGNIVTAIGKQGIDARNAIKQKFTSPISQALSTVAKNEAEIIEFNTALNVVTGEKNVRIYKAGKFWKPMEGSNLSVKQMLAMEEDAFLQLATNGKVEALKFNGKEFSIASESVKAAFAEMQKAGRELYAFHSLKASTLGSNALSDIGFWSPAANVRGKQIAYVFDPVEDTTKMFIANTVDELKQGVASYKTALGSKGSVVEVVFKGENQRNYNMIAGRHDPLRMGVADLSKQHGGSSARAVISTNTQQMADMVQGYDHYLGKGIDDLLELQLNPVLDHLERLSTVSQHGYSDDALGIVERLTKKPNDPANVVKNILMGKSNLEESEGWATFQHGLQAMADIGLTRISSILSPMTGGKGARTEEQWKAVVREMETKGIVNPFQAVEEFISNSITGEVSVAKSGILRGSQEYIADGASFKEALSPRLVALSNGLAATAMLRFADLAQPLVNMLSLPILTTGAVHRKMAASFMGAELDPMAKFSATAAIYDGVRLMNHPLHGLGTEANPGKWGKVGIERGLFDNDWRVVNGIMQDIRSLDKSLVTKAENLLDSGVVKKAAWAADKSETLARQTAFFTGVSLAKKAYPGLSDVGVVTFARNFMDEAIGNYAAAQRPAVFQGTLGVAMGLFQTYMLTMAQQIYRQVEHRDWRTLSKMMFAQQTIFGSASLPGFHLVSEAIGEHFSDNHFDLQTGTFRAVDDKMAQVLLYGFPSQLVGITTRGDIQPRIASPLTGLDSLAAVNITMQSYDTLERLTKAAFTADQNTGTAMLEALSLQSVSRPVARVSELLTGHSITKAGQIVDNNVNFFELGTISRAFGTRPIEEIQAREAMHLDTVYGQADSRKRKEVTTQLKSYISNGNLDQEILADLNESYMRTGSAGGWRSAVNEAIAQAGRPGTANVREQLSPSSAVQLMMQDLD